MKELQALEVRITQPKGRWGYIVESGTDHNGKHQNNSFRYDLMRYAKATGVAWLAKYKRKPGHLKVERTVNKRHSSSQNARILRPILLYPLELLHFPLRLFRLWRVSAARCGLRRESCTACSKD